MKRKILGASAALSVLLVALTFLFTTDLGAASYAAKTPFTEVVYLEHGGKGSANGTDPSNARALADADLWAIPAQTVIEKVYVVIDTGLEGTTNFDVGDDDDADGFVDGSLSIADLTVAGMYGWDAKLAGAYLRVQTAGGTDAADIDVVPNAKYYSAAGKEVKLDVTTASTAGKARVVIEGYFLGLNQTTL